MLAFSKDEIRETLGKRLLENQGVCKVMHGCINSDVWWLAKDFGIRTVSVFDTQDFDKYIERSKSMAALSALWVKHYKGLYDEEILNNKERF